MYYFGVRPTTPTYLSETSAVKRKKYNSPRTSPYTSPYNFNELKKIAISMNAPNILRKKKKVYKRPPPMFLEDVYISPTAVRELFETINNLPSAAAKKKKVVAKKKEEGKKKKDIEKRIPRNLGKYVTKQLKSPTPVSRRWMKTMLED